MAEVSPVPQHRPGDVVNGHVLTSGGQWIPIGPPAPVPPAGFAPGPDARLAPVDAALGLLEAPAATGAIASPQTKKKPVWKRWWFILLAAIILIGVIANLGGGDAETDGEREPAAVEEPAAQEEPTEEEAVEPEPEPEPEPVEQGTRESPYAADVVVTGSTAGVDEVQIQLSPANWDAGSLVAAENQFNEAPPAGHVYVLLPVSVTNVGSAEPISPWIDIDVAYVAADGRSYEQSYAVIPGDLSDIDDLYEGGNGMGNVAFAIPAEAVMTGVWAVSYGWADPVFIAAS